MALRKQSGTGLDHPSCGEPSLRVWTYLPSAGAARQQSGFKSLPHSIIEFDLAALEAEFLAELPLIERKAKLQRLFRKEIDGLRYTDHVVGDGPRFRAQACRLGLEGAISKLTEPMLRATAGSGSSRSASTARSSLSSAGPIRKAVARTSGRRSWAATPTMAGCTMPAASGRRAEAVAVPKMPLSVPPPRDSRFGSPLKLSKVHWVKPELVVEVSYLTWTEDNLLRQVSYQAQREDKPARAVIRSIPHPAR